MSERCMVKAGGPCQGPGKLPNTGPTTSQSFCELARRRPVHHVAGAQPVSVVQNLPFDLLDGAAELQHLTDGVGDWAGSLADDEQCAAGAARRALALLARLVQL